tara:strand:+ start:501 stop:725 length:225 start_codon:yes stop_codon:yes gene_type:complete
MSEHPQVAYVIDCYPQIVLPYDDQADEDIEDLGSGHIVVCWVPDSRAGDVDRNDTLRREVTAAIKIAIDSVSGG